MTTKGQIVKVTFETEDDSSITGFRYYAKEDWQRCEDHLNSIDLESGDYSVTTPQGLTEYVWVDDGPDALSSYHITLIDGPIPSPSAEGYFLDPMFIEQSQRDEYDGDDLDDFDYDDDDDGAEHATYW